MKRIIVCCDGTWNNDDMQTDDTNVSRLGRAIHGSTGTGGILQIVLYLRGVGTTGLKLETVIEGATGLGVDDNIRSAYQFIAQNFLPGDEIYLFGFSRGAFTARSVAGLVTACGILKRQSLGCLPKAWEYYRSPKPHSSADFAAKYKVQCHIDAPIMCVGVWDTVGSMGIPSGILSDLNKQKFAFYDTSPSPIVKHGFHAMAIDEHRHNFTPTYWTGSVPTGTTIKQCWFAGCHSDVGGGYVTRMLADIPLVWMAKQAESLGLVFDWTCLPDPNVLPVTAPQHDSSSGLFAIDMLHPTLREIGSKFPQKSFNEGVFQAVDENGKATTTINECLHRSVVERYGRPAESCLQDANGTCTSSLYQPHNLIPLFSDGLFAGLPVEG